MTANKYWSFSVVVNARRLLDPPLPANYIGNMFSSVTVSAPSQSIESTPAKVAETAHLIRDQIQHLDEQNIGKNVTALASIGDLARVMLASLSPSEDEIRFSSWASQRIYDINWGDAVGAMIERVRAVFNEAGVRVCIIMPELGAPRSLGKDCGQEVGFYGFEKGLLKRLKQDELFMRFAQWRCN